MAHKKGKEVGKKKITTTRVVRGGFGRVHFHHFVPGILTWMVMKLIRLNVLGLGGCFGGYGNKRIYTELIYRGFNITALQWTILFAVKI